MQIDLSVNTALPLALEGTELRFGADVVPVTPVVYSAGEMREVFYSPAEVDSKQQLYFSYNGLSLEKDRELFERHGLRYNLLIMPPALIGPEYVKTAGHYNPAPPETAETYPEVYEVVQGQAHFLLQYLDPEIGSVEEVILFEAAQGDKVLIPPDFGHVVINPANETLVVSNLVADSFAPLCEPFIKSGGAVYYEVRVQGVSTFIANPNYDYIPQLQRRLARQYRDLGLVKGVTLYEAFIKDPDVFHYLTHPNLCPQ
ncbi:MAG: glucose-6-phosphate isomerase [Firmicutes bacterium]|nr:glucose-6-phosphate isomerase [Bacillota bacterium]